MTETLLTREDVAKKWLWPSGSACVLSWGWVMLWLWWALALSVVLSWGVFETRCTPSGVQCLTVFASGKRAEAEAAYAEKAAAGRKVTLNDVRAPRALKSNH